MTSILSWNDITSPPKRTGLFAGALNPLFHDENNPKASNEWREKCGFVKVYYDGMNWWDFNPEKRNVTTQMTHWGELPTVPKV